MTDEPAKLLEFVGCAISADQVPIRRAGSASVVELRAIGSDGSCLTLAVAVEGSEADCRELLELLLGSDRV